MTPGPMLCPHCGIAMNHHADKVDYTAGEDSAAALSACEGLVLAVFTCPRCGDIETRPEGEALGD